MRNISYLSIKTEQGKKLFSIDYREKLAFKREEVVHLKTEIEAQKQLLKQQAQQPVKKKDAKEQAKKQPQPNQINFSNKQYVESDYEPLNVLTKEGEMRIENLEYLEDFHLEKYYYVISNKSTNSLGDFVPIKIEVIINLERGLKQQSKKGEYIVNYFLKQHFIFKMIYLFARSFRFLFLFIFKYSFLNKNQNLETSLELENYK